MQIMQLTHQKDGIFFVPKVFFGIDKVFEIEKKTNKKYTFLCKVVTFCGEVKNMCVCCCIS